MRRFTVLPGLVALLGLAAVAGSVAAQSGARSGGEGRRSVVITPSGLHERKPPAEAGGAAETRPESRSASPLPANPAPAESPPPPPASSPPPAAAPAGEREPASPPAAAPQPEDISGLPIAEPDPLGLWIGPSGDGDATGRLPGLSDLERHARAAVAALDPVKLGDLTERLDVLEDEIGLLARLRESLRAGILTELPASLLDAAAGGGVSSDRLGEEEQRLADLRREYRERQAAIEESRRSRPAMTPTRSTASHLFEHAAGLRLDVPAPQAESRPVRPPVPSSVDPRMLSVALERTGDLRGALEALRTVAEAERGPADRYREANLLERTGAWNEAKTILEALTRTDEKGFFGRQARWTLRLGARHAELMGLLEDPQRTVETTK